MGWDGMGWDGIGNQTQGKDGCNSLILALDVQGQ